MFTQSDENEVVTEESLLGKWSEFLETLNDRPNLKSAMNRKPCLDKDGTILLKVDNIVQDELVKANKPQWVAWFRRELKNSSIDIQTSINDLPDQKVAYTDGEKFEEMLRKNPGLALLKQKFNLDFGE